MLLKDLLYKTSLNSVIGDINSIEVSSVQFDSRKVKNGDLFVAINGVSVNGHDFIIDAIKNGARSIVLELLPEKIIEGICYIEVRNSSKALSVIASNYYDNPSFIISLTLSGGTAAIMSTSPPKSALTRVDGSGIGRQIILSRYGYG